MGGWGVFGRLAGWACRSLIGLKRRPGYRGRGSFAAWSGGAVPGYLLTNCMVRGQSLQDGRVCSLLRGHPDPSPPFRLVGVIPPVGREKTDRRLLIFVTT
ncbi:hypothetical protein GCM10010295_46400 [Streptomyces intermedius]